MLTRVLNLSLLAKMRIDSFWRLTRLEHGVMYGIGVLVGMFVVGGLSLAFWQKAVFGFLTALLIEAGTFALNDYCDYKSDVVNKRYDRPLVSGELSPNAALYTAAVATTLGVLAALPLGTLCFGVAATLAVLGATYDLWLKKFGVVGNFYIGFTMAVPFLFGALVVGIVNEAVFTLFAISLLAGVGREIMKGIMDVRGDALRGVRTVALKYGEIAARRSAAVLFMAAVALSPLPFFTAEPYRMNLAYLVPLMVADAAFVHASLALIRGRSVRKLRQKTLIAALFGLLAFLSGAVANLRLSF